jgi:hypothetical protein
VTTFHRKLFYVSWPFNWGHRQIIIWGRGFPDSTFTSLILDVPPGVLKDSTDCSQIAGETNIPDSVFQRLGNAQSAHRLLDWANGGRSSNITAAYIPIASLFIVSLLFYF